MQIVDPAAITSATGQIPDITRATVATDTGNIYSLNDYNKHIDGYIHAVVIVAFLLLLLTF